MRYSAIEKLSAPVSRGTLQGHFQEKCVAVFRLEMLKNKELGHHALFV
jgi:hypothetical protein